MLSFRWGKKMLGHFARRMDEIRQFVQLDDTAPAFGGIPIMVRFFNVLKGVAWCYICVFQIFFADPVQLPPVLDEAVYIANLGNKSAIQQFGYHAYQQLRRIFCLVEPVRQALGSTLTGPLANARKGRVTVCYIT